MADPTLSKPANAVNAAEELVKLVPPKKQFDPVVQAMHDEAAKDGEAYYKRLLEEAAKDKRAKHIDEKTLRNFLNDRYKQTSNNRALVIRRLNKIYDWLREYHFTWEREVLMLYFHFDQPGWDLIQAMFYIFTCKAIRKIH
uniref:Core-binding (CB) domain-containing protein n=1 Tax=Caenorhabditis tropicalis TaxID=1561998 RepID=A0A1I7UPV4_9PELO